jgi:hypothetical protein
VRKKTLSEVALQRHVRGCPHWDECPWRPHWAGLPSLHEFTTEKQLSRNVEAWLSDCELFGASFTTRPRSFLPMFNVTVRYECQAGSTTKLLDRVARELKSIETGH